MSNDHGAGAGLQTPGDIGCGSLVAEVPACVRLPATTDSSLEAVVERRRRLVAGGFRIAQISGAGPEIDPSRLAGSIEGLLGFARVPLGVAGPVRINGRAANGEFFIPLATSEGTLVASFQHSFNAMNRCGGAGAICAGEQVSRAPCFEFANLAEADAFARWLPTRLEQLKEVAGSTSRYCRLRSLQAAVVANTVYALFEYSTGDAAGQNMVTLATQAICERVLHDTPHKPRSWLVESMLSGDKRATPMAFRATRGRNVSAEIVLPPKQIGRYWRTDPEKMERAWRQAANAGAQTGAVGLQGNVANALAALFIACGQDVACVTEAATALTRVERTRTGELYFSITLPNLIVGTVGGGTYLPTAEECLSMLGCSGGGLVQKFAEICAVVALAGEIALVGAMAAGQFASAHAAGGRKGMASQNGGGQE
ncbi:MAG TPA: hydroxymethylglutaryl-CoA reductase [Steroidobacteraceae bacterium]|nr:hydroxymethylglutaryl-CoA reductase [Steroidobacteraceae bacterium]